MTYRPIVIAGDWNAGAKNVDRFRPRWVSARAGLEIHTGGDPICYPMSDAPIHGTRRLGARGSDHPVIAFTATGPDGQLLRLASWNALAGRDPKAVARSVAGILDHRDVVALQEISPAYAKAIAALPGVKLYGEGQNVVAARSGLGVQNVRHHRLSRAGWPVNRSGNPRGPWHAPATATSVRLAGWLRLMSVHLPNYERSVWHRLAYRQAATRIVRYVNRRRRRSTTR